MSHNPKNPNRFSPEIVRGPVQEATRKLVWHTLNRCGFRTSGFDTNEHLELFYNIETRDKHDVGFIAKGWEDSGFRIGNVIKLPMARIKAKQDQLPALMNYCATRGVAVTGEKLAGNIFEFDLDSVIYVDGFNKKVLYQVLESLSECTDKVRSTFVAAEADAVKPFLLPAKFHLIIDGYFGPGHEIEWKHRTLWYRWAELPLLWQPAIELLPGTEAWEKFWQAVESAGVWQWSDNYENPGVLDGTQWSLKLKYQGKSLCCVGSNAFPGCDQPDYPETCEFGRFIQAVRDLTGMKNIK